MIRKFGYIAFLFLCALSFSLVSCGSDDDDDNTEVVYDEAWKAENEQAFEEKKSDPEFTEVKSTGNEGSILMKQLQAGDGERVYYTSRVKVYYKCSTIDGVVQDERSRPYDDPFRVAVSSGVADYDSSSNPEGYSTVIIGWTIALQQMRVGDKWEVWIPWQLAYGYEQKGDIQPCSALIFEIEVVDVLQKGETK